jgi:uncharacterized membrane protein
VCVYLSLLLYAALLQHTDLGLARVPSVIGNSLGYIFALSFHFSLLGALIWCAAPLLAHWFGERASGNTAASMEGRGAD